MLRERKVMILTSLKPQVFQCRQVFRHCLVNSINKICSNIGLNQKMFLQATAVLTQISLLLHTHFNYPVSVNTPFYLEKLQPVRNIVGCTVLLGEKTNSDLWAILWSMAWTSSECLTLAFRKQHQTLLQYIFSLLCSSQKSRQILIFKGTELQRICIETKQSKSCP